MAILTDPRGRFRLEADVARDLLDAPWGRHLANELVGSESEPAIEKLASDRRWMKSTLEITRELEKRGRTDIHPTCIEGWMRLQYGVPDHLDPETFAEEVEIGIACHDDDPAASERLARSEGLIG